MHTHAYAHIRTHINTHVYKCTQGGDTGSVGGQPSRKDTAPTIGDHTSNNLVFLVVRPTNVSADWTMGVLDTLSALVQADENSSDRRNGEFVG